MSDSGKIEETVAFFAKCDVAELTNETLLSPGALGGSIMQHRLYAELRKLGVEIENPAEVSSYGDLLDNIAKASDGVFEPRISKEAKVDDAAESGLGVEIVELKNFPETSDFRIEAFYKDNFSDEEIANSILQQNPIANFAEKYAVKKSIIKATPSLKDIPLNKVTILSDSNGDYSVDGYRISMSSCENYAVASVIRAGHESNESQANTKSNGEVELALSRYKRFTIFLFILLIIAEVILHYS